MTIRFSTWVDSLVPSASLLAANDKIAVVTDAPDTRSITRNNLARSVFATVMTTDGDLVTRSGGEPTRVTRSGLANDSAFTSKFIDRNVFNNDGQLLTRASGSLTVINRSDLADDSAFTSKYIQQSVLTTDGDVVTRSGGAVARVTRSALADDAAFSSRYVPRSLVDAKGDLLVGTADDVISRIPVGSSGQVLTADPSETTGLRWESISTSLGIVDVSASRTLLSSDDGSLLVANNGASNVVLTVPPSLFSAGAQVAVVRMGTGSVSFLAADGVTIDVTPGLTLRAQYSVAVLVATSTSTFIASGDLSG